MVYADGSNPSVRKDIGVRLPFPALAFSVENSTNDDFPPDERQPEVENSTGGDLSQREGLMNWRVQAAGAR